jgi:predicted DNA binding protein
MATVDHGVALEDGECLRVVLDIWHPDCWTLRVTESVDAGLLGHGVYDVDGLALGRLTAFGDRSEAVDDLVTEIRSSPLTDAVHELPGRPGAARRSDPVGCVRPGNATRGLLVAYESARSISGPLLSRGLIPDAPVRIQNGSERWTVLTGATRERIRSHLAAVREEADAEINLERIVAPEATPGVPLPEDSLSERQRQAFELARERGYYAWPRGTSGAELAEELGISKATFLEHLRKAEAKLLDP